MANIDELDYGDLEDTKPATKEALAAYRAKRETHYREALRGCSCMLCRMAQFMRQGGKGLGQ